MVGAVLADERSEASVQLFANRFLFRIEIMSFARIGTQIVELGFRCLDELVLCGFNGSQLAPVEVDARKEGLGVETARVVVLFLRHDREQALSLYLRRDVDVQGLQQP